MALRNPAQARVHAPARLGAGAVTGAAEKLARVLVRVLDSGPTTPARIIRAVLCLVLAATVLLGTSAFCGPLDFQCKADAWGQGVVEGLRETFGSLTQSMIQGIFSGSLGTIGEGGWNAGITLAGRVGAIMAIVVVALAAVQIAKTLVGGQRDGVLRAAIGAALAWPVASAAVWVAMQLVHVVDAISENMVEESHIQTLSSLTDFTMTVGASTPLTGGLVALFFVFCVFIPTVLLSLMMAFRNYGIVLAVAIAPVSLMVWGFGPLREMSRGWVKVVLALILTKPVLAIALVLAAEMIVESGANLEIGGFLTGVAGLGMAVFAPFAAMGMVSGAMAVADGNVMRGAEGAVGRFATRAGHDVAGRAKQVGSTAVGSAAQSNPKTAALWNMSHGNLPFQSRANAPDQPQGQTPPAAAAEHAGGPTGGHTGGRTSSVPGVAPVSAGQPGPAGAQAEQSGGGRRGPVPGDPGGSSSASGQRQPAHGGLEAGRVPGLAAAGAAAAVEQGGPGGSGASDGPGGSSSAPAPEVPPSGGSGAEWTAPEPGPVARQGRPSGGPKLAMDGEM